MPEAKKNEALGKSVSKGKGKGLSGARSYKVIKSNDLIQKARFDLTVQEQKIILYLISKLKPDDDKSKTIKFEIKEFCSVCGINIRGPGGKKRKTYAKERKTRRPIRPRKPNRLYFR